MEQIMAFMAKIVAFFQSAHVDAWIVSIMMLVEFWLGRTDLVKPGSTIEVVLVAIKKVVDFIKSILGMKKV